MERYRERERPLAKALLMEKKYIQNYKKDTLFERNKYHFNKRTSPSIQVYMICNSQQPI